MDATDRPADSSSRRQVLLAAAAAVLPGSAAGVAAAQGDADDGMPTPQSEELPADVAQERAPQTRALIIPPQDYEAQTLVGDFVYATDEVDPIPAAGSDACEFATWPDERARAYQVRLIDREDLLGQTEPTTLYVPDEFDVVPDGMYMVRETNACPESSYRGVVIQKLGLKELLTPEEISIGRTGPPREE